MFNKNVMNVKNCEMLKFRNREIAFYFREHQAHCNPHLVTPLSLSPHICPRRIHARPCRRCPVSMCQVVKGDVLTPQGTLILTSFFLIHVQETLILSLWGCNGVVGVQVLTQWHFDCHLFHTWVTFEIKKKKSED